MKTLIEFSAVDGWSQEITRIVGTKYDIPELPEFEFAIHRHLRFNKKWVISETSTGLMFTYPGTIKEQAELVKKRLETYPVEKIKELILSQQKIPTL